MSFELTLSTIEPRSAMTCQLKTDYIFVVGNNKIA